MLEKIYTTFQAARICGVRPTTIIKWANEKKIKVYVTPGGHRRIQEADLLEFLKRYRFPIPQDLLGQTRKLALVIEDDAELGRLLQKALQKSSDQIEAQWIQDGMEALLSLGNRPPDLVILDVVMPIVDGARFLATLRSDPHTQGIKVIGITGERLPTEKLKYVQSHSNAFYLKPFDINHLVQTSHSLLGIKSMGHPVAPRRAPRSSARFAKKNS